MGWGIGFGAGPLYYSKRLGGRRRDNSGGSGESVGCAVLLVLVLLGLAIKYWYVVVPIGAAFGAFWLIGQRRERKEQSSTGKDAE